MFSQNTTLLTMTHDTQAHRVALKRRPTEDFSERANKRLHEDIPTSFQNSHVFVAYPSPVEQFPACLEMCPEPTLAARPRALARKRANETGAVNKENFVGGVEENDVLDEQSAFDYGDALQRQINKCFVGRARALHNAYKEMHQTQSGGNDQMNLS